MLECSSKYTIQNSKTLSIDKMFTQNKSQIQPFADKVNKVIKHWYSMKSQPCRLVKECSKWSMELKSCQFTIFSPIWLKNCCSQQHGPEFWLCCFTSTETVGLLGTGAQDGHLDFHTAHELWWLYEPYLHVNSRVWKCKRTWYISYERLSSVSRWALSALQRQL